MANKVISPLTTFFRKLPNSLDPVVRLHATFDIVHDTLRANNFQLNAGDDAFELVRHAVLHLLHKAYALNKFHFWEFSSYAAGFSASDVTEESSSVRLNRLFTIRKQLRSNQVSFDDMVTAMDELQLLVTSMRAQFQYGIPEDDWRGYEEDPDLAAYMSAALLYPMAARLETDWVHLRKEIGEHAPKRTYKRRAA